MNENIYYCHPNSLVETNKIGAGTRIWAFTHVLPDATIGVECNICDHCFIENKVSIGNNVTVKCGVYLWDGITIEDEVFIGPNVVFTNDLSPRSGNKSYKLQPTLIRHGASLGANSTILAGVTISRYALTGIGAVVTRDVPAHALVYGNPARQHGWVGEQGERLQMVEDKSGIWLSPTSGQQYCETAGGLEEITIE